MKLARFVSLLFLATMFAISCKKDSSSMLVGKWSIVNDRMSWTNAQTSASGDSTYTGQPADYYEFTSDSNLFIREGMYLDTGKYSFVSQDKIQTKFYSYGAISFGPNGAFGPLFTISSLTEHNVSLYYSEITPAGPRSELITLKR